MYIQHFGFNHFPFELAPNSNFLYLSKAHRKALLYLNYGLWNKDNFTLITGEIGSGKTILLQRLLKTIPRATKVITIYQTQLTPYELLHVIADQLQIIGNESPTKAKLYKKINNYLANTEHKSLVFVIDEAQRFPIETLEELRLLASINIYQDNCSINVIFCGQPELREIIELPVLEQLNQRIRLRFHINPLNEEECREYIEYRLTRAGGALSIFSDEALNRLYHYTHGLPRKINMLADTALTCGFADDLTSIDVVQIDEAAEELGWDSAEKSQTTSAQPAHNYGFPVSGSSINIKYLVSIEQSLARIADSLEKLATPNETTEV